MHSAAVWLHAIASALVREDELHSLAMHCHCPADMACHMACSAAWLLVDTQALVDKAGVAVLRRGCS